MRLHLSLKQTFWTAFAFEIIAGYPVEYVCTTTTNQLGGCFSTCDDVEELGSLLTVSAEDASRAKPCRSGHRCCALPLVEVEENDAARKRAMPDDDDSCGLEFSHSFRIVNGKSAPEGSHPWLVALYRGNAFQCGGALITNRYVLTASHCFRPEDEKDKLSDSVFFALMGSNNLTNVKKRITRRICRVATHAHYSPSNFHNDIALVELSAPVDITGKWIRTLCLPEARSGKSMDFSNRRYRIAGWGSVNPFEIVLTDSLMQIEIVGGSHSNCSTQFSSFLDYDPEIQFCAGDIRHNTKDACQGDSGGPLIQRRQSDDRFEIIGITSFGVGCATAGLPFGGYATVASFLPWINTTLNQLQGTAKTCAFEEVNAMPRKISN